MSRVKKKFLECDKHGLTLFRCKRICWNAGDKFVSEHTERCFKCIGEGKYKKTETVKEKRKHFRI